jgi:light-regulated signal transduction histidine kinase (bacteriophytochrome)
VYRRLTGELKVANAELSYANAELEQFTSIVSHDLQEPVRTIKSFLLLINGKLAGDTPPEVKTYVGKSIAAVNRMRELIQNLLQYSQLARVDIALETVSVTGLVSEALQNLANSVDMSCADIVIENELETVQGDRVQLVQLLQNLVSNALKFTDAQAPKVVIRSRLQDGQALFSVTDNGIGIHPSDLHKVFEIFRRLHTHKVYPGTGIGLAICKKIVDRHHGRIWLESEPGKGTTFYFTLNEETNG